MYVNSICWLEDPKKRKETSKIYIMTYDLRRQQVEEAQLIDFKII